MVTPSRKRAYSQNLAIVDVFPFPLYKSTSPSSLDRSFEVGQMWIYKNGDARTVYSFAGLDSSGDAIWSLLASGAGDLEALEGDSGGEILPVSQKIVIEGGENITTIGTAGTITIDLDHAVELATSMSSPIYTAPVANNMAITAAADQDIIMTLGDDSGNNAFTVNDTSANNILLVGSDTVSVNSGAISIGTDNQTAIMAICGGAVAKTLNIAHGSGAHTVSIGNATTGPVSMRSVSSVTLTAPSVNVAGNLILTTAGTCLQLNGGAATDFIGQVVLVAGTATIVNPNLNSGTHRIFLQRKVPGLSSAIGQLTYVINTGVNFVITAIRVIDPTATEIDDVSTIEYFIVNET